MTVIPVVRTRRGSATRQLSAGWGTYLLLGAVLLHVFGHYLYMAQNAQ